MTAQPDIPGLIIDSLGGACPTQAMGTMDGHPFYFRARHGDWSLCVSKPGTDPVLCDLDGTMAHETGGEDETLGWMEETAVVAILRLWYRVWFQAGAPADQV